MSFELRDKRIWVAGHAGMVGSALMRRLEGEGCELITVDRKRVDLRRQQDVEDWLQEARPNAVFLAAALVGGIHANNVRPAEFIRDNLSIEVHVIEAARRAGVTKLMLLGSSCIYPKLAPQPMREDALLTGPLEPTNEWYAIAKIAGIKLCQAYRRQYGCDFISVMPTNLYGPGDNFDLAHSHVIPGLMHKFHLAKQEKAPFVQAWGTGRPCREFLHVDDMADACVHLMRTYSDEGHVNIGTGEDLTILELTNMIRKITEFEGEVRFNSDQPDGAPRKLLDVDFLHSLGWKHKIKLHDGLVQTYAWFLAHQDKAHLRTINV